MNIFFVRYHQTFVRLNIYFVRFYKTFVFLKVGAVG
jgi:hypothetical protein